MVETLGLSLLCHTFIIGKPSSTLKMCHRKKVNLESEKKEINVKWTQLRHCTLYIVLKIDRKQPGNLNVKENYSRFNFMQPVYKA